MERDKVPWSEKYRPSSLAEFESSGFINSSITKLIASNNLPHLLFYGPPGTGKTSAILAICNMLYKPNQLSSMVLEMNASDDRGISIVRNEILSFSSSKTLFSSQHKLLILDEADSMTNDAQNALRRIIEKYTSNVRFCLICNYLSGIIPAIQSRCTRFRFPPLPLHVMRNRIIYILDKEDVKYTEDGLKSVMRYSGGDMRKTLNTIQSTYMSHGVVDEDSVKLTTGYPSQKDIRRSLDILLNSDLKKCFKHLMKHTTLKGITIGDMIKELFMEIRTLSLPSPVLCHLIQNLSEIEYNSTTGSHAKIHISALAASFYNARVEMEKLKA